MTIGLFHKGKFVSDSQITIKNNADGEIIRKILSPGFTKIQRDEKKRKKKPSIKKTVQFSGSVKAYLFVLQGIQDYNEELQYLTDIERLCLGDEKTPPVSFQLVLKKAKEKQIWASIVRPDGTIAKTGLQKINWNDIGAQGSGAIPLKISIVAQKILNKSSDLIDLEDLCSLAKIAIDHDDYCGGDIVKCEDVKQFSKNYGAIQIQAVNDLLNGVSESCVAEAHIDVESALQEFDDLGITYEVVESPYLKAQKNS